MQIIGQPVELVNRQTCVNFINNEKMIFGERLRQARLDAGLSQDELARLVGVKQATVAEAEAVGKSSKKILEYARALKVSPDWLAFGKGGKEVYIAELKYRNDKPSATINTNVLKIPLLNVVASMGKGAENFKEEVLEELTIHKSWAEKALKSYSGDHNLAFIHAVGDSMHPTFNDGDILMIDTGDKSITADKIFVLAAHNRLFIKRVRQRLDGTFEISSDNPSVKTVDVLNGDHEVEIKGRVIWAWNGRKL